MKIKLNIVMKTENLLIFSSSLLRRAFPKDFKDLKDPRDLSVRAVFIKKNNFSSKKNCAIYYLLLETEKIGAIIARFFC